LQADIDLSGGRSKHLVSLGRQGTEPSSLPSEAKKPAESNWEILGIRKVTLMVTQVEEPVDVSAVFRSGKMRPMVFIWRNRNYKIHRVLGSYRSMKGRYLEIYYSVMSETPEVYELRFSTDGMSWSLVRVHSEG
jgi:hypothetical protein